MKITIMEPITQRTLLYQRIKITEGTGAKAFFKNSKTLAMQ